MRKTADPWSRPLAHPLGVREGNTLKTLHDARAYLIALPEHLQLRQHWQHAAKLLLADVKEPAAITDQLTLALMLDGRLRFEA